MKHLILEIDLRGTPENAVEEIYDGIKTCVEEGPLNYKAVSVLADLTTELANCLKVEEACGE